MTLGTILPNIKNPTRVRVENTKGGMTPVYKIRAEGDKLILVKGDGMKLRTLDEVTLIRVETENCLLDNCLCKGGLIKAKDPRNTEVFVIVLDDNINIELLPN